MIQRVVAVTVGIVVLFSITLFPATWLAPVLAIFAFYATLYAALGALLGFIWPNISWRLGLWLFAIWPPMLLLMLLLGADAVNDWRREAFSLLGVLLILLAGCLGAWLGGSLSRRRRKESETPATVRSM